MQKIFFTPGPTQLYPNVAKYVKEALKEEVCSISHRGNEFQQIFHNTIKSLRKVLRIPESYHVFFLSSATEAMERVIENLVAENSYHFVNGAFSERFFTIAQELGKSPMKCEAEWGKGFDFNEKIPDTEMICFTQNETSTGTAIDLEDIYNIKKDHDDKIIVADIVSSVPYVDIGYNKVDCAFFSVQKGFGLPAGLGVLIVNDKCIEKAQYLQDKNYDIGSYHSFPSLLKSADKNQTPETPNVLGIYLLGKVCDELDKIGIGNIRKETEKKAQIIYDFFDAHVSYKPFVQNKGIRSKTVITINVLNSAALIKKISDCSFVVGSGYKELKDRQIRIANFPMHKIEDVERMLKLI